MFGYVHISPDKLNGEEQQLYRACYCGLCHTLGRRYGVFARMILNYDLVFLAMLLSDGEAPGCGRRRCLIHPIHPRCFCEETQALDAAADVSVLLTWCSCGTAWQITDFGADGSTDFCPCFCTGRSERQKRGSRSWINESKRIWTSYRLWSEKNAPFRMRRRTPLHCCCGTWQPCHPRV